MKSKAEISPEIAAFEGLDNTNQSVNFFDVATYVPLLLEQVASKKLKWSEKRQNVQTLLFGKIMQYFPRIALSQDSKAVQSFLKVKSDDGFDVYVTQRDAGLSQPAKLSDLVGQKTVLTLTNLVAVTDPKTQQNRLVAFGSIQNGQEILGRHFYEEYKDLKDDDFLQKKPQIGTISYISDSEKPFIRVDYNGLTITTTPGRLGYYSDSFPFTDDLKVGKEISFLIKSVVKTEKQIGLNNNGKEYHFSDDRRKNLSGTVYALNITRKPLLTAPLDQLKSLYLSHALCSARIAKIDPIRGILVEVVPGVQLKGYVSDKLRLKFNGQYFDQMDAFFHTPVSVQITNIEPNYETNYLNGRVVMTDLPQGFARETKPEFLM
ncbi:hypothetical protein [Lactiplantibacillus plantarum]|uniref:hypothetical protein n=1 Tax=Lactiplantibacillus plantarum TaxID=1590 RepID=UPI001BAB2FC3|nr:hypothetical protein [Lactiplantibacillus plantarum]MBS0954965.1 hypothetical protein [Lactiplantibacillus plantarum]